MTNIPELKDTERKLVNYVVYFNEPFEVAYARAYKDTMTVTTEQKANYKQAARAILKKPHVKAYYDQCNTELQEELLERGVWERNLAAKALMKLKAHGEQDLYDLEKPITVGRVNAIMAPVSELNKMFGYNQHNIKAESDQTIIFQREDDIPD